MSINWNSLVSREIKMIKDIENIQNWLEMSEYQKKAEYLKNNSTPTLFLNSYVRRIEKKNGHTNINTIHISDLNPDNQIFFINNSNTLEVATVDIVVKINIECQSQKLLKFKSFDSYTNKYRVSYLLPFCPIWYHKNQEWVFAYNNVSSKWTICDSSDDEVKYLYGLILKSNIEGDIRPANFIITPDRDSKKSIVVAALGHGKGHSLNDQILYNPSIGNESPLLHNISCADLEGLVRRCVTIGPETGSKWVLDSETYIHRVVRTENHDTTGEADSEEDSEEDSEADGEYMMPSTIVNKNKRQCIR